MSEPPTAVVLSVEGSDVLVQAPALRSDRLARMFFGSILGATATEDGWRCPLRGNPAPVVVVRINTFLEAKGWKVSRSALADEAIVQELERKRSYQRARIAGLDFRGNRLTIQASQVHQALTAFGWDKARPLRPHQEQGLLHALTAVNVANFSVPGSGKTATAIAVATTHIVNGTVDLVLVVGPLSSFRPWEKEIALSVGTKLTPTRVRGSSAKRMAAYAGLRPRDVGLISFASAAADRARITQLLKRYKVMLIVDESHRVKRFRGGLWAPALIELAKHARVRLILSGTPMPQSGRDLFSQMSILWPNGDLTGPRDSFAARVQKHFDDVLKEVLPFVSRTPKEALGLRPYEIQHHSVPLEGTQADIYSLVESQFRKRIDDADSWQEKIETLKRAKPIRLLQAAANPDLLNRIDSFYKLPKIDSASPTLMQRLSIYRSLETPAKSLAALNLVRSLVSQNQKVVCWSNFVPNLDHFAALVRDKLGVPCFQIDGRVALAEESDAVENSMSSSEGETRERIIDNFLNIDKPAVLVTNPASCSESISLHRSCHNAIYLDRTYDCALFLQSIDRIHRLGLPPDTIVRIHILEATLDGRPTIDGLVQTSLAMKSARMQALLEGAELKPFNLSDDMLHEAEGDQGDLEALLRFLLGEER